MNSSTNVLINTKTNMFTNKSGKGNKGDAKHFIEFYNPQYFGVVDDDKKKDKENTVSLNVNIDTTGNSNLKTNVAVHKVPQITDFANIEATMDSILQLQTRVLPSKTRSGKFIDYVTTEIQHIELLCTTGSTNYIFHDACKHARELAYDMYLEELEVVRDPVERDIVTSDSSAFYRKVKNTHMSDAYLHDQLGERDTAHDLQVVEMQEWIYRKFHQEFWTGLHAEMFVTDRFRAFQLEVEYLRYHIVKPFDVSVRKAFQRVDTLIKYLPLFPPRTTRDRRPNNEDWRTFEAERNIGKARRRDIQYAMLPIAFRDVIDGWVQDYEDMSDAKFLQCCEQIELKDNKDRKETQDRKDKLKRKNGAPKEEESNANRQQKSKNKKFKGRRDEKKPTRQGNARFCQMCKTAGAPSFVYESHDGKDCTKKGKYEKLLSGGAGQKEKGKKEYQSFEHHVAQAVKATLKSEKNKAKKHNKSEPPADDDKSLDSADSEASC